MHTQELTPPLIIPVAKEGIALHAEQTTQLLLDQPHDTNDIVRSSDAIIDSYFNTGITGEYQKAAWRVKIALSAVGHVVAREAMLDMLDSHHLYRTLHRPGISFDAENSGLCNPGDTIREAEANAYWLIAHTKRMLTYATNPRHPFYPLYNYLRSSEERHHVCHAEWHAGPGKNRWPTYNPNRTWRSLERIQNIFCTNSRLAVNALCAKAIHHLIHNNRAAPSEELYVTAMQSIPRISWITTGSRHYSWTPNWRQQMKEKGYTFSQIPADALYAFLSIPPSKLTAPSHFAASVDGLPIMQDANFCPHQALQDGPLAKSKLCAGNDFYAPPKGDARDIARSFFEALNMDPKNGDCYSLGGVALAMGGVTFKHTILPAYEKNKRQEAVGLKP